MDFDIQHKKIYFLGIGGIGMSAIARFFLSKGFEIHGYDRVRTELTTLLENEGMHIHYNEDVEKIPSNLDFVIYTPAVPKYHKEYMFFEENNIKILKRAMVLGIISRMQKAIAVAGTHGKTSTTSIITHVLHEGGIDCTAFLGGIALNFDSNYIQGKSDWVVVEADEFDRSFLHLTPTISILNSMDADHLDIYGNHNEMQKTFNDFLRLNKKDGAIFIQKNLESQVDLIENENVQYFSSNDISAQIQAKNIRVENGWFVFDYWSKSNFIPDLKFSLPGRHNIENATAAISVALKLGVTHESIRESLVTFKGIKRRFEFIVRTEEKVLIDDYAHHPTELNAAISATRELYPKSKITGIFQPHLYSRTNDFAEGFADSLSQLDELILLDIYPARELPMEGVTSEIIFNRVKLDNKILIEKSALLDTFEKKYAENSEVILILGAGDIDTYVKPIKKLLTPN